MDATTNRPMTDLDLLFRAWLGAPDAVEMARISTAANQGAAGTAANRWWSF